MQSGKATIEGAQGKADLQQRRLSWISRTRTPPTRCGTFRVPTVGTGGTRSGTTCWRSGRKPAERSICRADIAIVADDLSDYGTWQQRRRGRLGLVSARHLLRIGDPTTTATGPGSIRSAGPGSPTRAWGWAPYHYGTWVSRPYGWAWCPGPVNQYWVPRSCTSRVRRAGRLVSAGAPGSPLSRHTRVRIPGRQLVDLLLDRRRGRLLSDHLRLLRPACLQHHLCQPGDLCHNRSRTSTTATAPASIGSGCRRRPTLRTTTPI